MLYTKMGQNSTWRSRFCKKSFYWLFLNINDNRKHTNNNSNQALKNCISVFILSLLLVITTYQYWSLYCQDLHCFAFPEVKLLYVNIWFNIPTACFFYLISKYTQDEVAEWLRRWAANPLGSARVGSNPILVGIIIIIIIITQYLYRVNSST